MKKLSTTAVGREFEEALVKNFSFDKARRSPSSGAKFYDEIDITTEHFVIEAESTEKKSYSLKFSFWEEIKSKAHHGKIPLIGIRFRNEDNPKKSEDFILINVRDFASLMEEYYEEAKDRI